MKWERYTNDGAYRLQQQQYRSFHTEPKESDLAGYKDIFEKVGLVNVQSRSSRSKYLRRDVLRLCKQLTGCGQAVDVPLTPR